MMQRLFHHSAIEALKIAEEVDTKGRAVCYTTSKEVAELKRDQIQAMGAIRIAPRQTVACQPPSNRLAPKVGYRDGCVSSRSSIYLRGRNDLARVCIPVKIGRTR